MGSPNLGPKLRFLPFSQGNVIIFLDFAQDCSLRQCLTSSRTETSKKNFFGLNWVRNDLFYSNVVEHPHKLACFCNNNMIYFLSSRLLLSVIGESVKVRGKIESTRNIESQASRKRRNQEEEEGHHPAKRFVKKYVKDLLFVIDSYK